jgi:putative ABC transport system permease protein
MLVILLAAGRGISNGAETQFSNDATNVVYLAGGQLSKPFRGNPIGKPISLTNDDLLLAEATLPMIEYLRARVRFPGNLSVWRAQHRGSFEVRGCSPANEFIEKSRIIRGRYLNELDEQNHRKVAILGIKVEEALFPGNEASIGATLNIGSFMFTVVGVFEEDQEEDEQQAIYIPLSTAQLIRKDRGRINDMTFTVGNASTEQTNEAVATLTGRLASRYGFDPDDKNAVRVFNVQEVYERFQRLFAGIRLFVWIIGLGTILAGVVGVSNIMLISVQERTREIGVRKAVGAKPSSIIAMILEEALAITLVSGYLGLVAGVAVVRGVQALIPDAPYFRNPDVELSVGLGATAVLVVCGMLAGLFPALRAARISPMAALRVE